MGLEQEDSRRVALSSSLSGVLEVKDHLDRTGMKKWIKTAKRGNFMQIVDFLLHKVTFRIVLKLS